MKKILFFLFILFLSFEVSFAYSFDVECRDFSDSTYNIRDLVKVDKYSFNSTDVIKDYKNASQYSVQVLHDGKPIKASQEVKFIVNGVNYTKLTDENGTATLNINLEPGHYIVYSEYNTFKNYNNILLL